MSAAARPAVLGASGRLGRALVALHPEYLAPPRAAVDITRPEQVLDWLREATPAHLIHAAAIVGRREVEQDPEAAWRVNVLGTRNVARACAEHGVRLVYVSSASVFDGERGRYREDDVPRPRFLYGWTKLLGEQAVAMLADHVIVRTDFFVPGSPKYRRAFVDHYCSKLPVQELARALGRIAGSSVQGTLHVGCEREALYTIVQEQGTDGLRIAESEMPDFPPDLSLDVSRYQALQGTAGFSRD